MDRTQLSPTERELADLRANLETLATMVQKQMRALKRAILAGDEAELRAIIARDRDVDRLELSLDDVCMVVMGHRALLGSDLRFVIGAIDVASGLERIGDCIEYVARHLSESLHLRQDFAPAWGLFQEMVSNCEQIFDKAVHAWINGDAELAGQVPPLDDLVDGLQDSAYQLVIQSVRAGRVDVEAGVVVVLVANKLESIADIACHVARTTQFAVLGLRRRHTSVGRGQI